MAEALLKRMVGDRIYVDSCGLKPSDEEVDPFVAEVMSEIGCDVAGHRSKTFDDLHDASFDLVISLTPHAHHRAVEMTRGRAVEIEYWPTLDPTLAEGSREARLTAYREVRDSLTREMLSRFSR